MNNLYIEDELGNIVKVEKLTLELDNGSCTVASYSFIPSVGNIKSKEASAPCKNLTLHFNNTGEYNEFLGCFRDIGYHLNKDIVNRIIAGENWIKLPCKVGDTMYKVCVDDGFEVVAEKIDSVHKAIDIDNLINEVWFYTEKDALDYVNQKIGRCK